MAERTGKAGLPCRRSYLSLIYSPKKARSLADKLKRAGRSDFHAKDIFRASGLALLPAENFHMNKDRRKISSGRQLSPLLLIRDPSKSKVIVADGYHRLCAVYSYDEDAEIPCKIA